MSLGDCENKPEARCIKQVFIQTHNTIVIIPAGHSVTSVEVNGKGRKLPYAEPAVDIQQISHLFKLIRGFGFYVLYDGDQRLYIYAGVHYAQKVFIQS